MLFQPKYVSVVGLEITRFDCLVANTACIILSTSLHTFILQKMILIFSNMLMKRIKANLWARFHRINCSICSTKLIMDHPQNNPQMSDVFIIKIVLTEDVNTSLTSLTNNIYVNNWYFPSTARIFLNNWKVEGKFPHKLLIEHWRTRSRLRAWVTKD